MLNKKKGFMAEFMAVFVAIFSLFYGKRDLSKYVSWNRKYISLYVPCGHTLYLIDCPFLFCWLSNIQWERERKSFRESRRSSTSMYKGYFFYVNWYIVQFFVHGVRLFLFPHLLCEGTKLFHVSCSAIRGNNWFFCRSKESLCCK